MTINDQVVSILIMVLSGLLVGATIDFIRYFLSILSRKSILRKMGYGVELFVWALLGALTFYILFNVTGGQWRLVYPLAQISGIFLYEAIFQPVFRFVGRVFILLIIKPILFIFKLSLRVIVGFIKLVLRIILIVLKPFKIIYTKLFGKNIEYKLTKIRRNIFKNR